MTRGRDDGSQADVVVFDTRRQAQALVSPLRWPCHFSAADKQSPGVRFLCPQRSGELPRPLDVGSRLCLLSTVSLVSVLFLAGCIASEAPLFLPSEGVTPEVEPFRVQVPDGNGVLAIPTGTVVKPSGQSYYWEGLDGKRVGELLLAKTSSGLVAQVKLGQEFYYYLVEPVPGGYRFSVVTVADLPPSSRSGLNLSGIAFEDLEKSRGQIPEVPRIVVRSRSGLTALVEHAKKLGKLTSVVVSVNRATAPQTAVPAAPPSGLDRRVKFVNSSGLDVTGVFASRRGAKSWGQNRLPSRLSAGQSVTLDLADGSGSCNFDVQVLRADRRYMVGLYDACATSTIEITKANSDDLDVDFVNRTAGTIRYLFVGGGTWRSDDLLGAGVSMATDVSKRLTVRDTVGCIFYVRAVYWDESDLVIPNVDLCTISRVEIAFPKR